MKLTDIKVRTMQIPLKEPFEIFLGSVDAVDHVVVEVHSDCGAKGLGDVAAFPTLMGETVHSITSAINNYLWPAVENLDPFDLELIHYRMDRVLHGNNTAKAAVDFAVFDLLGNSLQLPVYKLLGGEFRDSLELTWVIGIKDADRTADEAVHAHQLGYNTVKVKIGHDDNEDYDKICRIRERLPEIKIRVDANQAYGFEQALSLLTKLLCFNIEMIEQPLPRGSEQALAKLSSYLNVPILADESFFTLDEAFRVIECGGAQIFNIKVSRVGGLFKAKKIISLIESAGLSYIIGNNLEVGMGTNAGVHLGLTGRNIRFANDVCAGVQLHSRPEQFFKQNFFKIQNGFLTVAECSGLGAVRA